MFNWLRNLFHKPNRQNKDYQVSEEEITTLRNKLAVATVGNILFGTPSNEVEKMMLLHKEETESKLISNVLPQDSHILGTTNIRTVINENTTTDK